VRAHSGVGPCGPVKMCSSAVTVFFFVYVYDLGRNSSFTGHARKHI